MKTLFEFSSDKLLEEFIHDYYPKWSTACMLKYLNVPVLNSMILYPNTDKKQIIESIEHFVKYNGTNKITLRTDAHKEKGDYIRGGNCFNIDLVKDQIVSISSSGRAIILVSQTNRFTNKKSINLLISRDGYLKIEFLGPGFDVSDLNRGLVVPELIVTISRIDWDNFSTYNAMDLSVVINHDKFEEMRTTRLIRIANEFLPNLGLKYGNNPRDFATDWLLSNGYNELLTAEPLVISPNEIRFWYEISFIIQKFYSKYHYWDNLTVSSSDLGYNIGLVFWDVVNPTKKFSMRAAC